MNDASPINWTFLTMGLLGGLSFFLYGMNKMSKGMQQAAGPKMRSFLNAITNNRIVALLVGGFVTMIMQSSSATSVMLVSFVQAGLMNFVQSIAVILGSDIGSTITAQLVAFKITKWALLFVIAGFLMEMLAKNERHKDLGTALLGFGILFFGMKLMSDAMFPLRSYPLFVESLANLENPFLGILVGAIFTALIQSSGAFTGIIIVLAQQNLITLEAGIPLIMGANIGTCVTAGLASIGTKRDAKRVAIAYVGLKILGVIIFVSWIPTFASMVRWIGEHFNSHAARNIANAHTLFNVTLALVFLPFTKYIAQIVFRIYPEPATSPEEKDAKPFVKHLDENMVSNPAVALQLSRSEIFQMIKLLERMLGYIMIPFVADKNTRDKKYPHLSLAQSIRVREDKIDFLEKTISKYLLQVSQHGISDNEIKEVFGLISIMNNIESIGDVIERNMLPIIARKKALPVDFSKEGKEELKIFHTKICKQLSRLKHAFQNLDSTQAQRSMTKMNEYFDLEAEYRIRHLERLRMARKETIETHEIHVELMDLLKQINVYSGEIAKTIAEISPMAKMP